MNLPLFIAQRTARSTASTQRTMVRIATVAVAVSIAVMLVTLAVVVGFRREIRATISDMSADIVITDLSSLYGAEVRPIHHSSSLQSILDSVGNIERVEPYAMRGCVIRSKSDAKGIVIKGESSFAHRATIADAIIEGSLPRMESQRYKELLLPESVADKLGVGCGERGSS